MVSRVVQEAYGQNDSMCHVWLAYVQEGSKHLVWGAYGQEGGTQLVHHTGTASLWSEV